MIKDTDLQSLDFNKSTNYDKNVPFSEIYDLKTVSWIKRKGDISIIINNTYLINDNKDWQQEEQYVELQINADYEKLEHIKKIWQLRVLLFALEMN